ncbi:sigma-70 family RNA polymerase sigma factor [Streptomyces sp. NBC_00638]|uniref:RNA polymerase sigma factor n=1 Tax=unclassified Streptomyces TaxID=2593676 RepID=UPI00224FBD46|nr:sigma-70 family RNA polymerase sigma factor [Streptomyces sp. NBC_00638]MCX5008886.1 sigma-70 family RNA polymerase sigma factor [Streptomyces sp. NBC_00638]
MNERASRRTLADETDEELLRLLARHPHPAARVDVYAVIAERHRPVVLRCVAGRVDADDAPDIVQDTFVDAFRYFDQYGSLGPPYQLEAWLVEVARRRVLKYWSRGRKERPGMADRAVEELKERERVVEAGHDLIRLERVHRLLGTVFESLDEDQRDLYRLRNLGGLTGREIAARKGEDPNAVSKACTKLDKLVAKRFHVLLLVRDGATRCAGLGELLADHERQNGPGYTAALAERVVEHYSTCRTCGKCSSCRTTQQRLIWQAAPVAIPVILAAAFRERVELALQEVSDSTGLPSHSPQPPPPPSPPGPPDGRPPGKGRTIRRRAVRTGAAVAVTTVLALLALRALNAGAAPKTAPDQRAAAASAITSAMVKQRLVAFDINARPPGDPNFFVGQGRLDMTRKPVRAATHVLYDYGEGHNWTPPDIVLVGGSAYVTPDNTPTTKGAGAYGATKVVPVTDTVTDLSVRNALEAQWLAQPADLSALIEKASAYSEKKVKAKDSGPTLRGTAALSDLAADPTVGVFYRPYLKTSPSGTATFTLTTDSRHLPTSLTLNIPVNRTDGYAGEKPVDTFSITYRNWADGKPITATDPAKPTPQWGGTA